MSMAATGIMNLSAKSRNKLLGVAVASGLVAASLSGVEAPTANAWCVGISGINLGGGCTSTFGNFAFGLGPTAQANSNGVSVAIALGDAVADSTGILTAALSAGEGTATFAQGIADVAIAAGTNVFAQAGNRTADFLNFAMNFGNAVSGIDPITGNPLGPSVNVVDVGFGGLNLAANLGGNANSQNGIFFDSVVLAGGSAANPGGFGNVALNVIGNRNVVEAFGGLLNIAANMGNLFTFPNGSDSTVQVGDFIGNVPSNLSLGINWQPAFITPSGCTAFCGNTVTVANGMGSIAAAIGLVNGNVLQTGFGLTIKTPLNPVAAVSPVSSATALAASAPQKNTVGPTLNSSPAGNASKVGASTRLGGLALNSVTKVTATAATNSGNVVNNTVKRATGGLAAGGKAGSNK
jgi:hypothetical protein